LKVLGRAARVAGAKGAGRLREARQARVPDGVDGARGLRGVQQERRAVPARMRSGASAPTAACSRRRVREVSLLIPRFVTKAFPISNLA